MKEKEYYHIVTNTKMKVGQIIDFSGNSRNSVYNYNKDVIETLNGYKVEEDSS